jgi:hypothetical protein
MRRRVYWSCEKCGKPMQIAADMLRATSLLCDACERGKADEDSWECLKWLLSGGEPAVS